VSGDPNVRGTGENDPPNDGDEENTTTYPTRRDDTVHKINTEKSSNKNLLQQDTKEK